MIYRIVRGIFTPVIRVFFRLRVSGLEHVPATGPCILVSTHKSFLDPLVLGVAFARPITFMAKEELFAYPLLGPFIRALQAFPVRRGGADRDALRAAQDALSDGRLLGLFPEGTRIRDDHVGTFRKGVGLLARKTGAPVVPVALYGTRRLFARPIPLPSTLTLVVGEAVRYAHGEVRTGIDVFTLEIEETVRRLYEEARGVR